MLVHLNGVFEIGLVFFLLLVVFGQLSIIDEFLNVQVLHLLLRELDPELDLLLVELLHDVGIRRICLTRYPTKTMITQVISHRKVTSKSPRRWKKWSGWLSAAGQRVGSWYPP